MTKKHKVDETPSEARTPPPELEVRAPRAQHGITQWEFVWAWETSDTVDQAVEKLGVICKKAGKPPISRSAVLARTSAYRSQKIALKNMKRETERSLQVPELNKLIDEIRKQIASGEIVPEPVPKSFVEEPAVAEEGKENQAVRKLLDARPKKHEVAP